jgi:large subunit ribosomal protein L29
MANNKKVEDYRSLNDSALKDRIEDEAMLLKKLRFSHAVTPIENPLQIRQHRRLIARMKTEVRKRELGF